MDQPSFPYMAVVVGVRYSPIKTPTKLISSHLANRNVRQVGVRNVESSIRASPSESSDTPTATVGTEVWFLACVGWRSSALPLLRMERSNCGGLSGTSNGADDCKDTHSNQGRRVSDPRSIYSSI